MTCLVKYSALLHFSVQTPSVTKTSFTTSWSQKPLVTSRAMPGVGTESFPTPTPDVAVDTHEDPAISRSKTLSPNSTLRPLSAARTVVSNAKAEVIEMAPSSHISDNCFSTPQGFLGEEHRGLLSSEENLTRENFMICKECYKILSLKNPQNHPLWLKCLCIPDGAISRHSGSLSIPYIVLAYLVCQCIVSFIFLVIYVKFTFL